MRQGKLGRSARLLLLVLWLALGGHAVFAATLPTAADLRATEAKIQLILEAAQPITYRAFTMRAPDRIILDLQDTHLTPALQALNAALPEGHPSLRRLRVAQFDPQTVRIVLEISERLDYRVSETAAGAIHRIQLEVHGAPARPARVASPDARTADSRGRPEPGRTFVVAIDAGHGGQDPGAIGASGTREKDITLAIARRLKEQIDALPNLHAVLVRDGDVFVPLRERINRARRARADLFVSIHADAFLEPHARGSSVFALSEKGATSEAARRLANRENQVDLLGGISISTKDVYLAKTLLDLSQTATINDSLKLGKIVLSEVGELNHLHKKQVEQAGFAVLKAPDIPSILIETAFISNPDEERRLRDPAFQDRLARALAQGIRKYLANTPSASRAARSRR